VKNEVGSAFGRKKSDVDFTLRVALILGTAGSILRQARIQVAPTEYTIRIWRGNGRCKKSPSDFTLSDWVERWYLGERQIVEVLIFMKKKLFGIQHFFTKIVAQITLYLSAIESVVQVLNFYGFQK
jgi:hypothetical protein